MCPNDLQPAPEVGAPSSLDLAWLDDMSPSGLLLFSQVLCPSKEKSEHLELRRWKLKIL